VAGDGEREAGGGGAGRGRHAKDSTRTRDPPSTTIFKIDIDPAQVGLTTRPGRFATWWGGDLA